MADYTAVPPSSDLNRSGVSRCTEHAPESLCGDLRPLPQCHMDRDHTGNHTASRRVYGVGKVTYKWKTRRVTRPQVDLPFPHRNGLTGKLY